jgi:RNA polymerase sigma factor for flagellar operon FliA
MFKPLSEEVWADRNNPSTRALIVEHYIKLVEINAAKTKGRMPSFVEMEELKSMGAFGLLDAIDRFEFERGLKFETFASTRIYGSIIDGLRQQDWVPRGVRNKQKLVEKTYARLEDELLRSPTMEELSTELNMPIEDIGWIQFSIEQGNVLKLDTGTVNDDDENVSFIDTISSKHSETDSVVDFSEISNTIAETINGLPEKQRIVLTFYYYQGFSLVEISRLFGITQSRVSQLYSKGIKAIHEALVVETTSLNF